MEVQKLIENALEGLRSFLHDRLVSRDLRQQKTGKLLAYWLIDYVRFLRRESSVHSYRVYKRGSVVKVHLGFRIGSEEGGLHYAIVITPNDSKKSSTLVVIPLTSLKTADKVNHLHFGEIFLGSELLQKLLNKTQASCSEELVKEIAKLKWGSIALANQIVTISKLRIYDPVNSKSPLHGIRLGSESMDLIDAKLKQCLFNA